MQDKSFDIEEELKKLPKSPGVYIMHSDTGAILYVGKAISLHNRVRQYFRAGHGHNDSPKILRMVSQIAYFEYIVTKSELEALVLECNLIKEHRPKYNTMMTDDKGYPYIRISINEDYPRIMSSHRMKRDGSLYFGPFTDRKAVKDTIMLARKLFRIRTCNRNLPKDIGKERPCLYYQIGQCSGPCNSYISKTDYGKSIESVISFLEGNHSSIVNKLKNEMMELSENLEFEEAAKKRDLIESIERIMERQRVAEGSDDDRDIIALARNERDAVIAIFFERDGKLIGRENHHMKADVADSDSLIVSEFIKQYYTGTPYIPKEVLCEVDVDDREVLEEYLSSKLSGTNNSTSSNSSNNYDNVNSNDNVNSSNNSNNSNNNNTGNNDQPEPNKPASHRRNMVHIRKPQRGDKAHLIKLASDNARLVLEQDIERIKREEKRTTGACEDIAALVGIDKAYRMEAFDISHISGMHSVASMVVFDHGKPKPNSYRKFRLRTVTQADDYAAMKEVLSRRYTDEKLGPFPDVLMMDGGKGQVNVAEMVLDSLGIDIPVCGMVKDDSHRTRGLYYKNKEVEFPRGSEAMHMITALQDETHRFAITYHRQLRSTEEIRSILDDIPGVGPKRRKALLLHFGDTDKIKDALVDELMEVDGITETVAENIYEFFHGE